MKNSRKRIIFPIASTKSDIHMGVKMKLDLSGYTQKNFQVDCRSVKAKTFRIHKKIFMILK